jgi:hypothetical protein
MDATRQGHAVMQLGDTMAKGSRWGSKQQDPWAIMLGLREAQRPDCIAAI